ncbi:uncharacterized protein LOC141534049 [Cotesia typhae]|uniref:uncharacterized protein LOC141534049 n=1 Tax=Cotesia typhae TaxID=2053667 RepID=UPI003D68319E
MAPGAKLMKIANSRGPRLEPCGTPEDDTKEIPGIEAKKITSMGKDVQVTKDPYQPNKSVLQLATGMKKDTTNQVDTLTEQSVTCNSNCCSGCRSVLYSVSRKLDTLLSIIGDNPRPNTIKASDILPKFPICNHEDLVKFNKLLTDKEAARTQYENFINQRRHVDGKKCIRVVLGHILTDDLCCKLSWSGQKNTIKVENMAFVKYLRDAVTGISRSSLDECKQAIMSWLQHANDRIKKSTKHMDNPQ